MFQENKARQIFRQNEHFLSPDTDTYVCVSGGKKYSFCRKIWRALFSWNTRFEIPPFALLPTNYLKYIQLRKMQWNNNGIFFINVSTGSRLMQSILTICLNAHFVHPENMRKLCHFVMFSEGIEINIRKKYVKFEYGSNINTLFNPYLHNVEKWSKIPFLK